MLRCCCVSVNSNFVRRDRPFPDSVFSFHDQQKGIGSSTIHNYFQPKCFGVVEIDICLIEPYSNYRFNNMTDTNILSVCETTLVRVICFVLLNEGMLCAVPKCGKTVTLKRRKYCTVQELQPDNTTFRGEAHLDSFCRTYEAKKR